ncbi:UvrD-helicase domain-containing protein [Staphylococcus pseudintermedius]
MAYEDFWILVWLYTKIVRGSHSLFKHIIVDEVQDYSVFQLDILRQCYDEANFTFLGDLNQNFLPKSFIEFEDWDMTIKQLTTSYRSTKAISRYLDELKHTDTKVVSVEGDPVIKISSAKSTTCKRHYNGGST